MNISTGIPVKIVFHKTVVTVLVGVDDRGDTFGTENGQHGLKLLHNLPGGVTLGIAPFLQVDGGGEA